MFDGLLLGSDQAIFGNAVRFYGGNLQVHAPAIAIKRAVCRCCRSTIRRRLCSGARAAGCAGGGAAHQHGGHHHHRGTSVPVAITAIQPDVEAPISLQAENVAQGRFLRPDDGDAIYIGRHWPIGCRRAWATT